MNNKLENFEDLMLDYLAGKLSQDGEKRLLEFLQSDESFRQKYKEMTRLRAKSFVGKFEKEKQANYNILSAKIGLNREQNKVRLPLWHVMMRVAAVFLLLVSTSVAGYYIYRDHANQQTETTLCQIEAPIGSQSKLILPDGTIVHLNSGTVLKYDPSFLQNKNREIYLSGEGFFEVKRNPEKPFIVHADAINVKVLGTVFNVRSYSNDPSIKVSLLKGKVNVFGSSETQGNMILLPNQQLTYDKKSGFMTRDLVDAQQASQWTTGRLSFVNELVPDIMKDIERKYNVRIVIHSKFMNNEIFSGSISPKLTIDEIIDYMDVDNKYSWSRSGNIITITDKRQ